MTYHIKIFFKSVLRDVFFRPKTVKNHIPEFNFRHNTCICPKNIVTLHAGIVFVMFSGARRLELRQNASYGNDPEYQAYVKKTPILIPLLPIYSVAKYEWLKA